MISPPKNLATRPNGMAGRTPRPHLINREQKYLKVPFFGLNTLLRKIYI